MKFKSSAMFSRRNTLILFGLLFLFSLSFRERIARTHASQLISSFFTVSLSKSAYLANPVFTTSPSSGQQLITSFSYNGSNLTPNGAIERWGRTPLGIVQNYGNVTASGAGTISWSYTYNCSDPVGTHAIWIRDISKNFTTPEVTNTISVHPTCAPSFTTSPSSGQQLVTNFSYNGSNLTPNGVIQRFGRTPTGIVQNYGNVNASGSGTISWSYTYTCGDPVGTHAIWIKDVSKNYTTPEVTNTVSAHTNCLTPTFSTSPSSGQQLVTSFNYSGGNLTSNGVIERWGRRPNGSVQNFGNTTASSSGTISWNYTYTCSDPIGTHSVWVKDVSKNFTTPEVTNTVSAHTNCATPSFTTSPSGGQQLVTSFNYSGSNLTANGVIERWGRTPSGTVQNFGNMNASSSGTLSWNYTYTCADPVGTHSVWIKDVSKNFTTPEATNTVTSHTNCATPSFTTNPSSGQQIVTSFSYNGSNLTANGVIERWGRTPSGTVQNFGNVNANAQGIISWNYTYTCSDLPGTHAIWIKDVTKNYTTTEVTNTVSLHANCTPAFTTNPASGQQTVTNFSYSGNNLTPNGVIERWGRTPNGMVQNYGNMNATAAGTLSWNYIYTCNDPVGTHFIWIKDVSKNFTSPEVTNTITAHTNCLTPVFTTSPASGQQLVTNFSYNGSNLTANGVIERWGRTPNGTVQNYGNMNASSSGTLAWNFTYTCADPVGTHSIWIKDVSKNFATPEVTNTVLVNTNCQTPVFTTNPASGQQSVTNFSYNGSNLTPGGVIERWGRTPAGLVQNYGSMNATPAGTLTWSYIYNCSDPTGTHAIWIKDVSKNHITPEVTNTVSANAACVPANKSLVWTGSGTVYWFQNGKLYGITSQSYLDLQRNAGVPGWTTINTFSNLNYPQGPLFVSLTDNNSNGLLLKLYGSNPAVYLIQNQQKRILSFDEFNQSGYSFSNVIEVGQTILNLFPDAPSPTPVPTLNVITPLTSPTHKVNFNARLEGVNFTTNMVEIVVTGPGCTLFNACVIPNGALSPAGVSSTIINSAPFKLDAGTFNVYVRNTSSGSLSNAKQLVVNPATLTPTIDIVSLSTTPLATHPFTVDLTGSGFERNTVRVEITGPSCPCIRNNNTLSIKTETFIRVAIQLDNPGSFQIAVRNGSNGTLSNSKPITVFVAQPSLFALSGKIGIVDDRWLLDGNSASIKVELFLSGSTQPVRVLTDVRNARYEFDNLPGGIYDVQITLEYLEQGGAGKPSFKKWVKRKETEFDVTKNPNGDVYFPPFIVLAHGIWSGYQKWYGKADPDNPAVYNQTEESDRNFTDDTGDRYWDQYLRFKGASGDFSIAGGFITIVVNYQDNIRASGGWPTAVDTVFDQIKRTLEGLSSGYNNNSYPPWYYIGHSQGGLVGRALLYSKRTTAFAKAVKHIFLIATPNSGAPLGSLGTDGHYGYLSKDDIKSNFNRDYPNFGGMNRQRVTVYAGSLNNWGDTDKVVPVWSVHYIKGIVCEFKESFLFGYSEKCEEKDFEFFKDYEPTFNRSHSELGSDKVQSGTLNEILVQQIIPKMSLDYPSLFRAYALARPATLENLSGMGKLSQQTQPFLSVLPESLRVVSSSLLLLQASEAKTTQITVSNTDLLVLNVIPGAGLVSTRLINPIGQELDFANIPPELGERYTDGGSEWFVVRNPIPGQWEVTTTSGASYTEVSLLVQEKSIIGLEGYVVTPAISQNAQARLMAKWADPSVIISQPAIIAHVFNTQGNVIETVTLYDDGLHNDGAANDGIWGAYTASFTIPGAYVVAFTAQGLYQGYEFTRESTGVIDVLNQVHLFTGQFINSAIDSNADGTADAIHVTTPVNIVLAGKYLVTADLYDARGYFLDHSTTFLEANNSGTYSTVLDFDVSQANCEQFSQAFSMRNTTLIDASSSRTVDQWPTQVNTQVFNGLTFGCSTVPVGLQISSIQPNSVVKGNTLQVRVSGKSFITGTNLSLGSGITISSLSLIGDDILIAQITADANATVGQRDVAITNPDGRSVTATGLFAVASDQPPIVAISNLSDQQNLSGTVTVSASTNDDLGIEKVEFYLDGSLANTDTSFPYQFVWNTSTASSGAHTVAAKAFDTSGQTATSQVSVNAGCGFSLSLPNQSFTASGGNGSVGITTTSACAWVVISNATWITINGSPSSSGNGSISYTVAPNTGAARIGTITIAGQQFTVNQACGASAIESSPTNQAVCAGEPVDLFVTASGAGPFTYQWRKNGSSIAGATGSVYTILAAVAGDTGSYDVVVMGGCGTATSAAATLTVNSATAIATPPTSQAVCIGSPASFSVMPSGTGPFTYQWRKSGSEINGATGSSYSIFAAVASDAGNYDVVVTGTCGTATSTVAALTVHAATVITTQPTSQNATVGQGATFSVATNGVNLTYQWRKGGVNIAGATGSSYTIASSVPSDAGSYDVVVTGTCGTATSNQVTLTVGCQTVNVGPLDTTLPTGTMGSPYSQTFTQTGGIGTITWSNPGGGLPGGLTLNPSTGILSGMPTAQGAFSFFVRATDSNNCFSERQYSLSISFICPTVTVSPANATLPVGTIGALYSQTYTQTGGTGTIIWSNPSGGLPGGLILNASTGEMSGSPTTVGNFTFTIRATDVNSCSGERQYSLTVRGNGLMFYPLPAPVRLLETRSNPPNLTGCNKPNMPIAQGGTFTLPAKIPCAGIPANAAAVTGNITVVPSGAGYLTLFPSDATQPTVANSNFATGEITNNVFTVGLGAGDGAFKIFSSATTEVIIDVTGYYAPPGAGGLYFHPLSSPVRLLETRPGQNGCIVLSTQLNPNADPNLDLSVQGRFPLPSPCNSIPASAQVLVGNATSVLPSGGGHLTIYPSGGTRPTVASSNYAGSDVINGPFAVKLGADGNFKIYTFATTDLVVDILGYYSEDVVDSNGPGLLFNPLPSPVRLLETRPDFPGFPLSGCTRTNAKIQGNLVTATHTQQAAGFCNLPAEAQAVVGNVSVVNSAGAGFLTLFPGNLLNAPLVATSNYPAPATFGYNRHYFVGLSPTDGTFKILTQFTTDLILDASGYFAP